LPLVSRKLGGHALKKSRASVSPNPVREEWAKVFLMEFIFRKKLCESAAFVG